jgi:hypothetical protein
VLPRTKINFSTPEAPHPTGAWRKITEGDTMNQQ